MTATHLAAIGAAVPPRVLMVLPQWPQDPASGAARSMSTICEMLAGAGFTVRGLGTTASESGRSLIAQDLLPSLGISPRAERWRKRDILSYGFRGVEYRLLDVGASSPWGWEENYGPTFGQLFDDEQRSFRPDLIFTYGGTAGDLRRRQRARSRGARVVFGLRNESYLAPGSLAHCDAILTPSRYLTEFYRSRAGIESTPLPVPIQPSDVVASEHEPIFLTMVNPVPANGLMLFARLAEVLSVERPDLPILVIESRAGGSLLTAAGLQGGFDLRRHANIMTSPAVARPRDIYGPTRILLAPSLRESGGRVVAEALWNGIPPVVSDRGAQPEARRGAGFMIPIPADLTEHVRSPVSVDVVRPWIEVIVRLFDDDPFYDEECARARASAAGYDPDRLAQDYVAFFRSALS
jgi:hypothetical protein